MKSFTIVFSLDSDSLPIINQMKSYKLFWVNLLRQTNQREDFALILFGIFAVRNHFQLYQ